MEVWLVASLIVLFASSLQAATGFGFSVMATPFLMLVFEAHIAIQVNIILSLLISLIMVPQITHSIDTRLLVRLVKGAIIGAPIGFGVFVYLSGDKLKLAIGMLILLLTALLIARATIEQSPLRDNTAGGLSGILTMSLGMPGPPLLLYFAGTKMDSATLRCTVLAFFLFVYAASLLLQIISGSLSLQIFLSTLALAPIAGLGSILGQFLFRIIDQRRFRLITFAILAVTGIHLLVEAIWRLA